MLLIPHHHHYPKYFLEGGNGESPFLQVVIQENFRSNQYPKKSKEIKNWNFLKKKEIPKSLDFVEGKVNPQLFAPKKKEKKLWIKSTFQQIWINKVWTELKLNTFGDKEIQ